MNLASEHIPVFRDRFAGFADGVVSEFRVILKPYPQLCRLLILAQDREVRSGWSKVLFEICDVHEFRFERQRSTFEVLSSGVQFVWQRDLIFVVLDARPFDSSDLPDLSRNAAYVAGSTCTWEVLDHDSAEHA